VIAPVDIINNHTAEYFKLTVDDLYGSIPVPGRSDRPPDREMYLCCSNNQPLSTKNWPTAGNRDHNSRVMYANKKITELMKER
jgi:chromosomal replication initiator protein